MDLSEFGRGPGIPYLRLFRPGATSSLQLVILSDQLQPFGTHWGEGREQLCRVELQRPCRWCADGIKRQDSLYALAMRFRSRELGIAHITAGAYRYCQQLQDLAGDARGLCVELQRLGAGRSGVRASVKAERWPLAELPAVGDWLIPGLFRLWGVLPHRSAADLTTAELRDDLADVPLPAVRDPATPSIGCSPKGLSELAEGELPPDPKPIGPAFGRRVEDGSETTPRVSLGRLFRERKGDCNGN